MNDKRIRAVLPIFLGLAQCLRGRVFSPTRR